MIKRANKLTALLVAATAVASIVPAATANAATKLETKDGTIESAISYNEGKYLYDGYMSEDDESGLYFNNGSKDSFLEDDTDYDFTGIKYGSKYTVVTEDGDKYLLDLSTGKINDDETLEDREENLESKIKSTFKKVDRYTVTSDSTVDLTQINEDQFGDVWYSYAMDGSDKQEGSEDAVKVFGFANEAGKYIDASVTANITIANGTSTTKVTKFNDEKDGVIVQLTDLKAIAQDENNIYAIATVQVTGTADASNDGEKTFVQRISKAQGSQEDDAYLPSKVESFQISSEYALDGDADDFADAATLLGDLENSQVRVINNVIYITNVDSGKVTVSTIKLSKNKVTKGEETKKYDLYLATFAEDDDQDVAGDNAVSIDSEGNTWALNKGTIYKFNGKEFESVYTCDRSMDTLDVYNSENLVAWEDGEEVFSVAQGKVEDTTEDDKIEEDTTVQTGWVKNADGTWSYVEATGTKKTGWLNDNGTWYMLKADGIMATGWYNDNGTWYFLNASGAMQTGWLNDNGTWYYLNGSGAMQTGWFKDTDGRWYFLQSSGAMAVNTTVDGYVLGANGAWIK